MNFAVVLSLTLALAAGGAPVKGADAQLKAGLSAYARGDFTAALKSLEAAAEQASDDALLAKIHLARGQCFGALQEAQKAEAAFSLALEHDPEARLDPVRVKPSIVAILDRLRERTRGVIRVRGGRGALVLLDGKALGSAPLEFRAPIGRHQLKVQSEGRVLVDQEVLVRADRATEVDAGPAVVVKVQPPPPPVVEQPEAPEGGLLLFGDARALGEVGQGLTLEVGGGAGGERLAGSVHAIVGSALGASVRGTLRLPELAGPAGVQASLDVPVLFSRQFAVGAGASAGMTLGLSAWAELFVEAAFRHYFALPAAYRADYLLFGGGLRLLRR